MGRPRRTWLVAETGESLSAARTVNARCEQADIDAWFPQYRFTKIVRGAPHKNIAPLFPGYVFARCGVRQLLDIKGVNGVVRIGEQFCRLLDVDVKELRGREDADGFVVLNEYGVTPRFNKNDKVRILGAGPFSGQIAVYDSMSDARRHNALVELLGRAAPASFADEELEAVAA